MARPVRCRRICAEPEFNTFIPLNHQEAERVVLTLDEYEAIRLIDLENNTQEQCSRQMDISRTTVTEIYASARKKLADCLVNGKVLVIQGGSYRFCDGSAYSYCQRSCCKILNMAENINLSKKGDYTMRIAVTYSDGEVFQHFGHSEQFKIYDVEDGKIINEQVVSTNGQGHGALAGLLSGISVDVLICGGIGGGAQTALSQAGIALYGGVSGSADEAVKAFLAGDLSFNPDVQCNHHHHEEGHSCGSHSCGEDKHGCSGH